MCCASAPSSSDEYGNNKCKEEPDTDDDVVMDHGKMKHDEELKKPQVPQTQQTYWQCAALGHFDCAQAQTGCNRLSTSTMQNTIESSSRNRAASFLQSN